MRLVCPYCGDADSLSEISTLQAQNGIDFLTMDEADPTNITTRYDTCGSSVLWETTEFDHYWCENCSSRIESEGEFVPEPAFAIHHAHRILAQVQNIGAPRPTLDELARALSDLLDAITPSDKEPAPCPT